MIWSLLVFPHFCSWSTLNASADACKDKIWLFQLSLHYWAAFQDFLESFLGSVCYPGTGVQSVCTYSLISHDLLQLSFRRYRGPLLDVFHHEGELSLPLWHSLLLLCRPNAVPLPEPYSSTSVYSGVSIPVNLGSTITGLRARAP